MTKEEQIALSLLEDIQSRRKQDTEMAHREADDVLCDLLCSLGYAEVVKAYNKIEKWYA